MIAHKRADGFAELLLFPCSAETKFGPENISGKLFSRNRMVRRGNLSIHKLCAGGLGHIMQQRRRKQHRTLALRQPGICGHFHKRLAYHPRVRPHVALGVPLRCLLRFRHSPDPRFQRAFFNLRPRNRACRNIRAKRESTTRPVIVHGRPPPAATAQTACPQGI